MADIETVFVKFSVEVSEDRYSRYDNTGKGDLEFECPIKVLEQVEFVELFKSLSKVALQKFRALKEAEKE